MPSLDILESEPVSPAERVSSASSLSQDAELSPETTLLTRSPTSSNSTSSTTSSLAQILTQPSGEDSLLASVCSAYPLSLDEELSQITLLTLPPTSSNPLLSTNSSLPPPLAEHLREEASQEESSQEITHPTCSPLSSTSLETSNLRDIAYSSHSLSSQVSLKSENLAKMPCLPLSPTSVQHLTAACPGATGYELLTPATTTLVQFDPFTRLPVEIRNKIWAMYFEDHPRIVELDIKWSRAGLYANIPPLPAQQVNKETRQRDLERYGYVKLEVPMDSTQKFSCLFNPEVDMLHFSYFAALRVESAIVIQALKDCGAWDRLKCVAVDMKQPIPAYDNEGEIGISMILQELSECKSLELLVVVADTEEVNEGFGALSTNQRYKFEILDGDVEVQVPPFFDFFRFIEAGILLESLEYSMGEETPEGPPLILVVKELYQKKVKNHDLGFCAYSPLPGVNQEEEETDDDL